MTHLQPEGLDQADIAHLLRCRETRSYFNGSDWTNDPTRAKPFPNEEEAIRACKAYNLQNVELVRRASPVGIEISSKPLPST